jgi:hypothetical protein
MRDITPKRRKTLTATPACQNDRKRRTQETADPDRIGAMASLHNTVDQHPANRECKVRS